MAARDRRPPGPRGVPLLGMLPALRRDPIGVFTDAARRFGAVVHLKLGPQNGFLITHPDDIRHVLQDNARNYHKSPLYDKVKVSVGDGLLTSEDAHWLRQRRMAQPAFHRERIAGLAAVMAKAARETADRWSEDGELLDVSDEMMRLTQTIVLRTLLGADLGPFKGEVDRAWALVNEHIGESFWSLGLTDRWPTPRNRRFWRALAVLDGAVYHIITERRRSGRESGDLLSMLLFARDEETGHAMTDKQLRDEVMTMLLAGHETTSLALSWTYYLLSHHPDAEQRVADEVDRVIGDARPTFAHVERLIWTRRVIEESLRLYPPAWGFSRLALGNDEIGGYRVPEGSMVFLIPFVVHRRPKLWPDPERFDPERFAPERETARPRFAYIPFGGGPRGCIGSQFAMVEAQLIVASIAPRYRIELVPDQEIRPEPLITLRPKPGIRATIRKRAARAVRDARSSTA